MINIRTIRKLADGDGLTLKAGQKIAYKTGWQVADTGVTCDNARDCIKAVKAMRGNCGVWLENGIYYVDHSFRVKTKAEAIAIGKRFNQISVFGWARKNLAYCNE